MGTYLKLWKRLPLSKYKYFLRGLIFVCELLAVLRVVPLSLGAEQRLKLPTRYGF